VVEAGVSLAIALVAGMAAVSTRMTNRLDTLDRRVDQVELTMATDYVSKAEHNATLNELKEHMIRIENKLDAFIREFPKR